MSGSRGLAPNLKARGARCYIFQSRPAFARAGVPASPLRGGRSPERLMATLASPARRSDTALEKVRDKVRAGRRLDFEDGVALYEHHDLLEVGALANEVRERLHGDRTFFNRNMHINATNVCEASCMFCSFARQGGRAGRLHDVARGGVRARARAADAASPRSTSSTACTPGCRSTTTRSCCGASSASSPTSTSRRSPPSRSSTSTGSTA